LRPVWRDERPASAGFCCKNRLDFEGCEARKHFFSEEKKQKTPIDSEPSMDKNFLVLFYKKELLS
jgi:hypothetical protein